MIVVTVRGGLGNQMFQYAFGRSMAASLDRRLVLDLTMMPTGTSPFLRTFELPALGLVERRSALEDCMAARAAVERPRRLVRVLGIAARAALAPWQVREPAEGTILLPDAVPARLAVCVGYWQSHLYFSEMDRELRSELIPQIEPSGRVAAVLRRAEDRQSIAVHVRRGDYVEVPSYRAKHGAQPAAFYRTAVQRIMDRGLTDPLAIIVSDDPVWAKHHLRLDVETEHVELYQSLSSIETLALLSRCQHHVISNSSLSWWGAWLAQHPEQRVVYPLTWFVEHPIDPSIRFPAHWRPHTT
jgi:hypothetical protein